MRIVARYSFNSDLDVVSQRYAEHFREIESIVSAVDAFKHKTKTSAEKTMSGKKLYSPKALNRDFKTHFGAADWEVHRERCNYPTEYYLDGFAPGAMGKGAFREMDFVKDKLGIEVQLGKYAFMVYNVCAKMTIFRNLGVIEAGIEVVPVYELAASMSTGVSYFEQFVWDLERRGVAGIDVPVLILGIAP